MDVLQVRKIIDNTIIRELQENKSLRLIIEDIEKRKLNISNLLKKELGNNVLYELIISTKNIDDCYLNKRALYAFYYITQAEKRIKDLNWLSENLSKFSRLEKKSKIYNLFLFKEQLKENSYFIEK
jgi:hypothetical protein